MQAGRSARTLTVHVQSRARSLEPKQRRTHFTASGTEQSGQTPILLRDQIKVHSQSFVCEVFDLEHNRLWRRRRPETVPQRFLPTIIRIHRRVPSRRSPKYQCPPITSKHVSRFTRRKRFPPSSAKRTPWILLGLNPLPSPPLDRRSDRVRRRAHSFALQSGECGKFMLRTRSMATNCCLGEGNFANTSLRVDVESDLKIKTADRNASIACD